MAEAVVPLQNAPGQNVRTLEVTVLQANKTKAVVEMQVVSIADQFGNLLSLTSSVTQQEWMNQVLSELRAIRMGMELSLIDTPNLLELAAEQDSTLGDK